jgi:6-phosphogluconolactonase
MPAILRPFLSAAALAPMLLMLSAVGAQDARPVLSKGEWIAYVGTYTRQKSKGIYAYGFQPGTGKLTAMGLVGETVNPSFLAVHPNQRFLYAVNEVSTYQGQPAGSVSAFSIDAATGQLKPLNTVSSRGSGPCHVAVDKSGHWLFVANYNSGSVAAYPVHDDGTLGEASAFVQHSGSGANPQRQRGPHAHSANLSPDSRFVFVADLGLDQILAYRLDPSKGTLTANDPAFTKIAPGSGPRHMAFRPDGRFAYVVGEMSATVTAFRYDSSRGSLEELQTVSTLPNDFTGAKSGAEIAMHPNGKFLYASNRGHDSIAVFSIDAGKGTLTAVDRVPTQGKTPRNFAIDPTGAYLIAANQDSDNLVVFRIDPKTGGLTPTGDVFETPSPVCVTFAAVR